MHVGGLRTALYAYLIARKAGGAFILRIEDTDKAREVPGAVEVIMDTLRGAGLDFDETYTQSERLAVYAKYAGRLVELGGAYRDGDAIRQKIPKEGSTTFHDAVFGDITVPNDSPSMNEGVLLKSDGYPTYNFANVIDDHLMGITHVVRGSEYLSSDAKYDLLYRAFGWEIPEYITVSPVMRDASHKLSKRAGDPTYDDLLALGYVTEAVLNYVALLGWSPGGEKEFFKLPELVEAFGVSGISKSPALFDLAKLRYFNAEYIRNMPPEEFYPLAKPFIEAAVGDEYDPREIAALVQSRTEVLGEIPDAVAFLRELPDYGAELYEHKKSKVDRASSLAALKNTLAALEAQSDWSRDALYDLQARLAEADGVKNAAVMYPLRIAVSGRAVTPGGAAEIAAILGRGETLARVRAGISKLESEV
jgi:glutamyl-tRNA synthetase